KKEYNIGVILVTHDLGVVAETANSVLVMYAGRIMEYGPASQVFDLPQHPYAWGLLDSMPTIERRLEALVPIEGSPPSLIAPPSGRARRSGRRSWRPCRRRTSTPATSRGIARSTSARDGRSKGSVSRHEQQREPRRGHRPDEALRGEAGRVRARQLRRACGGGRVAHRPPRRDARHRRRVRLRQVHHRASDAAPARSDRRQDRLRRPRRYEALAAAAQAAPARDADDLPGSVLLA